MMRRGITICIPTYNRSKFLEHLLGKIKEQEMLVQPEFFEIIVSDNHSDDDTEKVCASYNGKIILKYFKRERNYGPYNNLYYSYDKSTTDYVVYCADDDSIDLLRLQIHAETLDNNSSVAAIYCPWMNEDAATGRRTLSAFGTIPRTVFRKGEHQKALVTILENHLFPEIGIFRRSALLPVLPPSSPIVGWHFILFHSFLHVGDIIFCDANDSYYTFYLNHPVGLRAQQQVGDQEAETSWDIYRGGLEVFLTSARNSTEGIITDRSIKDKIDKFVARRQIVALKRKLRRGNYIDAYWLARRISLYAPDQIRGAFLEGIRCGAAVELCHDRNFGIRGKKSAVLRGRFPGVLVEIVREYGFGWFINESIAAEDTPRISWTDTDPSEKHLVAAERYVSAFQS